MPKIVVPNDIINDTPADASPVEENFNRVEAFINNDVIERGGSVAMTAQLKLMGDPVAPLDAAPKQYIDALFPIGIIFMYGGAGDPPGGRWAECNGAELEAAAYPELYNVIGNRFSPAGTPAGRFNLPPLSDNFPMGASATRPAGTKGGMADAIIPAHTHKIDHNHALFESRVDAPDHNHVVPDHNHHLGDIGLETGGRGPGTHNHNISIGAVIREFPAVLKYRLQTTASGGVPVDTFDTLSVTTYIDNQDHGHYLPAQTGGTVPAPLVAGGASVRHKHFCDVPNFVGPSGPATGAAATTVGANLPPYVAMTWIIRVA